MVPKVAVECFAIEHFVRDNSVDGDVALQRLVVSVQSQEKNQRAKPGQCGDWQRLV